MRLLNDCASQSPFSQQESTVSLLWSEVLKVVSFGIAVKAPVVYSRVVLMAH